MADRDKYISFANTRDDLRIYNKPFWLDAVCGPENWDAVVIEENGEIVAALPFSRGADHGEISTVLQPQLTQCLDLWTKPLTGVRHEKHLHQQFLLIEKIAKRLLDENADCYILNLSPELDNWEPFYWAGFSQQTRYSFVIDGGRSEDDLWSGMNSSMRSQIRKAFGKVVIEDLSDIDTMYKYLGFAFSGKGMANPVPKDLVERLFIALKDNNALKMLAAKANGEICAAGLYAFDSSFVYELLLGTDPSKKHLNGKSLMTYEMIRFALESGRGFDFEGSMIRSIAEHNRRFGASMVPYHEIWKVNTGNPFKRRAIKKLFGK